MAMGAREFGTLVSDRMGQLRLSQNRLASRLGELPDGRIFDATQIRMIREGRRRLDQPLVARLIEILDLDPDEAWAASGLLPPEVSAEELRQLRQFRLAAVGAAQAEKVMPGKLVLAGQTAAIILPFERDRRRRQRRRRLVA